MIRFQFSVRVLLWVTLAFAMLMSFSLARRRAQDRVESLVESKGGWVSTADVNDSLRVYADHFEFFPEFIRSVIPKRSNCIYAASPDFNDEDVKVLLQLPGIEGINLSSSKITSSSIDLMIACKTLVHVQLYNIENLDDSTIRRLKRCREKMVVLSERE